MRRRSFAAGLAATAALAGTRPARAEGPLKISMGWAITPAQMPPIIFANTSILKHYGKSYFVELTRFNGSSTQITALAAGEVNVAALAFSSFGIAIQNARMTDLRVIGDLYQDGVEGYATSQYVVAPDSPVKTVKDLKGKVIATNGVGGAIDIAMRAELAKSGMIDKRDYSVIEVQFPNMPPMLEGKKVDLAGMVLPFSREAINAGKARSLFTIKDAMGVAQTTLLAARQPFIDANRAAMVDFFEDMQIGTRWLLDPANRAEALKIVASVTKQPEAVFADWLFTKADYYHDPAIRPNLTALQSNLKLTKELGFMKIDIDLPKFTDMTLVDAAEKRA